VTSEGRVAVEDDEDAVDHKLRKGKEVEKRFKGPRRPVGGQGAEQGNTKAEITKM
jgi:hypothetical protein